MKIINLPNFHNYFTEQNAPARSRLEYWALKKATTLRPLSVHFLFCAFLGGVEMFQIELCAQNTKCKKSLQQHIEKKNWKLHTQNTWILIARIETYLKNGFASVGLMEYLLFPGLLVCFAHTKPNFRLCVASKNLKLLIASPLVVAKTFERCKPSIKCQNIGFNVKYNSASPVALVSGVQKLCGFVSSSIFLKTLVHTEQLGAAVHL